MNVGKFVERIASAKTRGLATQSNLWRRVYIPFVFKSDRFPSLKATANIVFSRASSLKCSINVERSKSRKMSSVPVAMDSAIFSACSIS